ncbi:MAG: hypothetical protein Q4F84_09195 [Fibrobacter sp.]|nr:hypothetical protein [Fibrobacter sp.]
MESEHPIEQDIDTSQNALKEEILQNVDEKLDIEAAAQMVEFNNAIKQIDSKIEHTARNLMGQNSQNRAIVPFMRNVQLLADHIHVKKIQEFGRITTRRF